MSSAEISTLPSPIELPRSPTSAGKPAAVWGPLLGSSPPLAASGRASGLSDAGITFPGLRMRSSEQPGQGRLRFPSPFLRRDPPRCSGKPPLRGARWMGVWTRPAVRGTPQAEDLKARAGSRSPRPLFSLTPFIRCQQGAKCAELARGGRPAWAGEGRRQRAKACCKQETRKQDAADTPRLCRGSPCPCPCLCPWGNANDYADSAASLAEGNLVPPRPAVAIGSAQSAVPSAASSRSPPLPFPSSASLPPAAGPLPGTSRPWRRLGAFSLEEGEVPIREWGVGTSPELGPGALRGWMGIGEVSLQTVGKPRGRPRRTALSCLLRRVGRGDMPLNLRSEAKAPGKAPPLSLESASAGGGVLGPRRNNGSAPPTSHATPTRPAEFPRLRAGGRQRTHTKIHRCVDLHARSDFSC